MTFCAFAVHSLTYRPFFFLDSFHHFAPIDLVRGRFHVSLFYRVLFLPPLKRLHL